MAIQPIAYTPADFYVTPILAKRYRESFQVALSSTNPLITCIDKYLDTQTYIILETTRME